MNLSRRNLLIAGGAFLYAPRLPAEPAKSGLLGTPPGKSLGFNVMRKGDKIGEHLLTFDGQGDNLKVQIDVELKVGLGPIVLFRYKHHASEVWMNGQLAALDTETNDDGTHHKAIGRWSPEGFRVEGSKAKPYVAPPDALPATHWNRKQLDGPWINTQDGRLLRPRITPMGDDKIPVASGATIPAQHFSLTGDAVLETYYDNSPNWVGLNFKAGDGSVILYERV